MLLARQVVSASVSSKKTRVQRKMVLVVNFFVVFFSNYFFFCFVVAIFDLVHDVEAIHGLNC